jgi:L-ascorbate metabolism protein UlaG (beta-lactamase superfamily)
MKVTRYFQSCLLIEDGDTRILIDPSGQEASRVGEFGKLDAVLYTHEHSDHFDPELAKKFVEEAVAPVYANASTAKLIEASKTVVENNQEFKVGGMAIKAIELPHCLFPDGSEGPQNTGYLINAKFFDPGDGKELDGLSVDALALPINGPDISLKDAYDFAMQVQAKQVVPVHYDYLGGNPDFIDMFLSKKGVKTHALKVGESTEL